MENTGICPLCGRELHLVAHHFIPTTLHKENWYKRRFTQEQFDEHVMVCVDCHNAVHKLHEAKELADNLNTLDKLKEDEKIMKFAKFAAKQKNPISTRTKKGRDFTY